MDILIPGRETSMSTQPPGSASKLRATIRDVAALAGVGTKTVSRVINDEANVSPQTRARVERAVMALNFKPNQGAGALRRGDRKTLTLGLLLDAVDNPFSALINRAVETVAYARDTAVIAASSDNDPDRERTMVDAFTRRRVDGLILSTITEDQGYLHTEREQGTPLVFVDRPPNGLLADAVVTNNYVAAIEATRHLINYGHRRIAYLGNEPATSTVRGRFRGFTDAVTEAGLAESSRQVNHLRSERDAHSAVNYLMNLDSPPTALFTSHYAVTLGAIRALHELRLEHRVAFIAFDDITLADLVSPAITVMAQDATRLGALAAERIFARLDGDTSAVQTVVAAAKLIARGSGEIPPSDR
jgi:LacI family transcriptional regulator